MRDIASGVFIFIVLVAATPQVPGWYMLAGTTAVVMLAISVLLLVA